MIAKVSADISPHFFLGEMLHLSGFIPLDKFPSFEANYGRVFQLIAIGPLNIFYCEL
jgi:hypothetical protein